jgi:hypothetical protein
MAVSRTSPLFNPHGGAISTSNGEVNNDTLTKESRRCIDLAKSCYDTDPSQARDLLERIYTIGMQITIPSMCFHRVGEVVNGYVQLKDFLRARAMAEQLKLLGNDSPDSQRKLSNILGNMESAYQTYVCKTAYTTSTICTGTKNLEELLKTVLTLSSSTITLSLSKIETLVGMSQAFQRLGDKERALFVLDNASLVLDEIGGCLFESERQRDALALQVINLAKELLPPDQLSNWLKSKRFLSFLCLLKSYKEINEASTTCTCKKNLEELSKTVLTFNSSSMQVEALIGITKAFQRLGNKEHAFSVLDKAAHILMDIWGNLGDSQQTHFIKQILDLAKELPTDRLLDWLSHPHLFRIYLHLVIK